MQTQIHIDKIYDKHTFAHWDNCNVCITVTFGVRGWADKNNNNTAHWEIDKRWASSTTTHHGAFSYCYCCCRFCWWCCLFTHAATVPKAHFVISLDMCLVGGDKETRRQLNRLAGAWTRLLDKKKTPLFVELFAVLRGVISFRFLLAIPPFKAKADIIIRVCKYRNGFSEAQFVQKTRTFLYFVLSIHFGKN